MTQYALFKNGVQDSKPFPTKRQAVINCYERKLIVRGSIGDFIGDPDLSNTVWLPEPYEIREING